MTETHRQLGRYELSERLAAGGMGEIYLAKSRGAGGFEKTVIIKTILPHLAEDEEFVEKFLDEGRTVVNLTHGNIVPVFDMGEENGEYFIAMEYVPGRDLREILKFLKRDTRPMPVELALYITSEICKGLSYAHRKSDAEGSPLAIVHRDVSPSNVLISREGEVKIIDFGIARATSRLSHTMSGRIQGKCCYMSPEQALGKPVDARSDIFSTGIVLYEMLTGIRPFQGNNDLESLDMVRQCVYDPPSVLNHEVDSEIDVILMRAMAKNLDERYASIDQFQLDLLDYLYTHAGKAITSQNLAGFMAELFPDGVEREAPIPKRATSSTNSQPLDLDDALNLELQKLSSGEPHSTNHPSVEVSDPSLNPSAPGSSELEQAFTATLLAPDGTPSSSMADVRSVPDTPATNIHRQRRSEPPSTQHSTPELNTNNSASIAIERPNGALIATRKRHVYGAAILSVLIAFIGAFAWMQLSAGQMGTLYIDSTPAGAKIMVNGAQLIGVQSPHTVELEPGEYAIQLWLEGYQSRSYSVELTPGKRTSLSGEDTRLVPIEESSQTQPTRQFTVQTDPGDATITANGEPLGSSPQVVEVGPSDIVNISAIHPNCNAPIYTISYSHQSDSVSLSLTCTERATVKEDNEAPAPSQTTTSERNHSTRTARVPRQLAITIETIPAGAAITVNDNPLGASPVTASFAPHEELIIQASHTAYQPAKAAYRAQDIPNGRVMLRLQEIEMGCLDFRAMYPAHNEIAINSKWLDGRHMKLHNHPLPVGTHTITVRNPEAEKLENFTVTIEPGSSCAHLVVWER